MTSRRTLLQRARDALPDALGGRLRLPTYRYTAAEVALPPPRLDAEVRLYIGPVNFAGQGFEWARAAEHNAGVGAHAMQFRTSGMPEFAIDSAVTVNVYRFSRRWQYRQFEAVAERYTHVLLEAARPLFGPLFDDDPIAEVAALRERGLRVGLISHGSDLRDADRHGAIDEWSPFHDGTWGREPEYRRQSARHRALLAATGAPLFVSTPELLLDWSPSTLLPLVVNAQRWQTSVAALVGPRPRVVHVPSSGYVKGTPLIEPLMVALNDAGLVSYRQLQGIPHAQMPGVIADSDIVLEQFRIGTYSVAAVEAMAAGRLVIAHLHEQVREAVRDATGLEIPIVSATPATLEQVLRDVVARPQHYRLIAAQGPEFVRAVHDGRRSAAAMAPFLGRA